MKVRILTLLLLLIPSIALAGLDAKELKTANRLASQIVWASDQREISEAINLIISIDPHLQTEFTPNKIISVANDVAIAQEVTGVDWRILLSVMYVESRMCHKKYLHGDGHLPKPSLGCMQVNTHYWGDSLKRAGIPAKALLNPETGIIVGAMILKKNIDRFGLAEGIKRYNGSGKAAADYRDKVLTIYWLVQPIKISEWE